MMQGRIWVDSHLDRAANFTLPPRSKLHLRGEDRALPGVEDLAGRSVLVVDDNATNRRILRDMLTQWKMQPVLAEDGALALLLLEQRAECGLSSI